MVGAAITALVLLTDFMGLFRWLEDWTLDIRLRDGRWEPEHPSEHLRLVAIDDASLDTIGRWPWPRSTIAMAVEEIARSGAAVAAFDILFLEPEEGTDGDRRLAEAMRSLKSVVALSVREEKSLDAVWETPAGRASLNALALACRNGIDRDIQVIVDESKVPEPFRSRILDRPATYKALGAWLVLEQERKENRLPRDSESFVALMLGGGVDAQRIGNFGERPLIQRAWERGESWRTIGPSLKQSMDAQGSAQDLPPIREVASAASMFGVVNAEPDRFDGRLRRVSPLFATDRGLAPQLGIAAALAFMGKSAHDMELKGDTLHLGDRAFQLRRGKLTLDWSTDLLAGYGNSVGGSQHDTAVISIGRLVEQAQNRKRVVQQKHRLAELGLDIAKGLLGRDEAWFQEASKSDRFKHEVDDIWTNDYADAADDPDLTPEQRVAVASLREWRLLESAATDGAIKVAEVDQSIQKILKGTLVFVGFTATGVMADMVNTIFDPRTPGVFGHIGVADMILNNRSLRFAPAWTSSIAILLLGLTAAVVAARFGAGAGFAALLILLIGYAGVLGIVGFDRFDVVYPMAAPVSAGLGSWVIATAAVAMMNQRERKRIQKQFRARVSPQLVDMLAENPKALSMEGVERETSILFCDLAGFTTISETIGGPEVVRTLNLYMGALTRELTEKRAYVNKFLGDGLLAFWSAFDEEPDQCALAVAGAMACQKIVKEIGERPERAGLPPISLRIGIATGKVVIGDCGAPPDLNDYTVIGDTANLSSRLESANKQFGTSVLVDGRTAEGARSAGLPLCKLGRVVVVGQSVPVEVLEVCLEPNPLERITMTEAAVECFGRADFDGAKIAWSRLEARFGPCKTAAAFQDAMKNPNDLRDGVLRLRAK